MDTTERYVQRLPAIGLAIERATERTPDSTRFHVFLDTELKGSCRKLSDAQALFSKLRVDSGWRPTAREVNAEEMLAREAEAVQRLVYAEYWGNSHKFRSGGRPKRRQGA